MDLGGLVHCRQLPRREIDAGAVMMFIWLVPLGIIVLLMVYIFGKLRAR
jgi:hypothetical protein